MTNTLPGAGPFSLQVAYTVSDGDDLLRLFGAMLRDRSLFVRHDRPAGVGQQVLLKFNGADGSLLTQMATVVTVSRPAMTEGEEQAGMGLRIIQADAVGKELLRRAAAAQPQDMPALSAPPLPQCVVDASQDAGPMVGIDLGTTTSCLAIYEGDEPRMVCGPDGTPRVPTVLFLGEDGTVWVGHRAKEKMVLDPKRGIAGSKRFLGRAFDSKEIRTLGHFFTYDLVPDKHGRAAARVGGMTMPLTQVAAHVLRVLREAATEHVGVPVQRAIITVPAYFGESQRQAVREAGTLAGFRVERLINEPTAAAVGYGFGRGLRRNILVYDFGGGTFDATVLRVDGAKFEVLATDGDPFLGGSDFDDRLTEYILLLGERTYQHPIRKDPVAVQRVRMAAEEAKKALSQRDTTIVEIPYLCHGKSGPIDLHMSLTRSTLESLTQDLVERSLSIVDQVLSQARLRSEDLDDVLVVGGQSRSPQVRARLEQRCKRELNLAVHPEEAVALGAAVVAHATQRRLEMQLADILPASIQVQLPNKPLRVLLRRGTRLPTESTFTVPLAAATAAAATSNASTPGDVRPQVALFRGEGQQAQQNTAVGILELADLLPQLEASLATNQTKATQPSNEIQVRVQIDAEGRLKATAMTPVANQEQTLRVRPPQQPPALPRQRGSS